MEIAFATKTSAELSGDAADKALVRRVLRGNQEAFETLLERHIDQIHSVAWKYLRDSAEAEDVVQKVCVRLATKLKSYRGASEFNTWLYEITKNAALDVKRRKGKESKAAEEYERRREAEHADRLAFDEKRYSMKEAVECLPTKLRKTYDLIYKRDFTHAEAGEELEEKEGTISSRVADIKQHLRNFLNGEEGMVS